MKTALALALLCGVVWLAGLAIARLWLDSVF
jgi:hypothetical protein